MADRDDIADRLERVEEHVGDLRERQGRIEGQVVHLTGAYQRAADVATKQVLTDLEVKKAGALADIADRKQSRKQRRELAIKGVAVITGLFAIISAALTKC